MSIVVPTYREAENLRPLAEEVAAAMDDAGLSWEMVIADDDSGDGTEDIVAELAERLPVQLLLRKSNRGLSPAVIDGIDAAKGRYLVVMDADLSHPPGTVPDMVAALESGGADFVIGSRYVDGGTTDKEWSRFRRLNSRVATMLVRPLVNVNDPMAGFFAFRRALMPPRQTLSPIGYKIGLEILVKGVFSRPLEIPIHFRDRLHGESKLTFKEQLNYLRHLRRLYRHKHPKPMEIAQFCAVGAAGFALDVALYYLLQAAGADHAAARAVSFWPAVMSNWYLNRVLTFGDRRRDPPMRQLGKFAAVAVVGFWANWGTYALLTGQFDFFAEYRILAFVAGVAIGMVSNFVLSDTVVFVKERRR